MKCSLAKGLVWTSLLGICFAATPGLATTNVLLNADFNDKPLNTAIGTGGPNAGEPIFVHPSLEAKVQATPLSTPSLHIRNPIGSSLDSLVFEFPGQAAVRDGDLRIAYTVRSPSTLMDFRSGVSEPGNSTQNFGLLKFTGTGNIHATDAAGFSGFLATYVPDETLTIEYIYHLDAKTYDLRINNVLVLANRNHGVSAPGAGIGRVAFATNQTTAWVLDDVFVAHTRTLLLKADFNDKQLDAPIGTGGAAFGEPTAISSGLSTIVRAAPLASPSLHFSQTTITAPKTARFEFLGGAEVRAGELQVTFHVRTPAVLDTFRVRMRQLASGADLFGGVEFNASGQLRTLDSPTGNTTLRNYSPNQTLQFRLVYQLAAGTYDIYVDGVRVFHEGRHGVTDPDEGLGAIEVGLTGNSSQEWVFDELRVEHLPLLLAADFNQQPLNRQIGTGGAGAGQPVSVNASLMAEPRGSLFPTRSLTLQQASTGTAKLATFELIRNAEIKEGELRIGMRVQPPVTNDTFTVKIHEQGSSTANFATLSFLSNRDVRLSDSTGNTVIASYFPGASQQFEFRYHLGSGKYDVYVERQPSVLNRTIPGGRGIGGITVGTTASTSGVWAVDDLHVYVMDDTIFSDDFD